MLVLGIAKLLQNDTSALTVQQLGYGFFGIVVTVFAAVSAWAAGQGIKLAMDCEDHLRHIRDQQRTAPASGSQRRRSA